MKKKLVTIITMVSLFGLVLAACGGGNKVIKSADFEGIKMGLAVKEVKDKLGSPTKEVKDHAKASELLAEDMQSITGALASGDTKLFGDFFGDGESLATLTTNLTTAKDIVVYQYKFTDDKDKEQTKNIYLVKDKVIFMTFN